MALTEGQRWFREWFDSRAFRIEVIGRDLVLIPLPEPTEDYVDVPLGTWTPLTSIPSISPR